MQPNRDRIAALAKWGISALAVAAAGACLLSLLVGAGFGGGSV